MTKTGSQVLSDTDCPRHDAARQDGRSHDRLNAKEQREQAKKTQFCRLVSVFMQVITAHSGCGVCKRSQGGSFIRAVREVSGTQSCKGKQNEVVREARDGQNDDVRNL